MLHTDPRPQRAVRTGRPQRGADRGVRDMLLYEILARARTRETTGQLAHQLV